MKTNHIFRRALSLLLCLCMVMSMGVTAFAADTTQTSDSPFVSAKTLTDGGDTDPETYTIDIDALINGSVTEKVDAEPLDVSLILDRSDSMTFPANTDEVKTFTTYAEVEAFLNTLDPEQLWDGYYRATNLSYTGNVFYSERAVKHERYTSWEPIRYNKTTGQWETYVTTGTNGINGLEGPHGIVRSMGSGYAPFYGSWVSMESAFNTFKTRQKSSSNFSGAVYSIAVPFLTKAQIALEDFITGLNESADNLDSGEYHTVSLVSYGGSVFVDDYLNTLDGKNWTFHDDYASEKFTTKCSITSQELAGSRATDEQKQGVDTLINDIVKSMYTQGTTYTNLALEVMATEPGYLRAVEQGRNRVVILLTDGTPTGSNLFDVTLANKAIATAKTIKSDGTTSVYSVGFMKGIDSTGEYETYSASDAEGKKAQNFLHLVSSNYPNAENMTDAGDKLGSDYFMADTGSGEALLNHFLLILEKIITVYSTPLSGEKDSVSIYDEITREFMIDGERELKVYIQKYNGNNSFEPKEYIGSYTLTADKDETFTADNKAYRIDWDCEIDKADPNQPDVDLDISSIRLNWLDAKNGALREEEITNESASYPEYTLGYKIGLELPIKVNRENTLGGNNILTNTSESGLYLSTIEDTSTQPDPDNSKISYEVPNANVEAKFDTEIYDYFMDLKDLVANQNADVNSDFAKEVFAAMLEDASALLEEYLQNNMNDYVDLGITLEDLYALLSEAGSDAFTVTGAEEGASFDFTVDQILEVIASLTYTSNDTDSIGVPPFQSTSQTLKPNYYAPKYVVVDFDEIVKVPLDNEAEEALNAKVIDNKYGTIENGEICYDFREIYGSGDKEYLEGDYATVKYQVTAKNPPKSDAGNKTVDRNFYVFPANVMTYDDTFLTYYDNEWVDVDAKAVDSETPQSNTNRDVHGYDSIYEGEYSKDYYHNAMKGVTVSADVYDEGELVSKGNGIAQATFTVKGTGFDIFSQTSPNSGTITVEVATDAGFENIRKIFVVDTYLKEATLNQIPVVRYEHTKKVTETVDGEEVTREVMDYGTLYVRVTAFYDSIFDHNYISQWRSVALTEEKLRDRYDIPADVDFTFVPSESGYDHPATRKLEAAKDGQYNIYIDGIRVYNTLGTSLDAVETYAYAQAGEGVANIVNMNDGLIDAKDIATWEGLGVNGVLYSAVDGSDVNYGETESGIILGMEGALYTVQDGDKFYVYKDAEKTVNVTYNGNNVYYCVQEVTSPNGRKFQGKNYFYDGGSAAKPMTMAQIKEAFGSMPVYYNAKYSQIGPEKEIYLSTGNGVAFEVSNADKVMVSFKSHDGSPATLSYYNGVDYTEIATTTSRVEMYYDITDAVKNNMVFLQATGGTVAVCNIKTTGVETATVTVSAALVAEAAKVFKNAGLPVDDSADIMHTLDLESDISMNYVVPTAKLADYDYSLMEVTFNGATYFIEPEIRGAFGYFTVTGITAVDMTEKLTATLHLFLGEEEFISETDVYSVADYAYAQLNKADVSEELKAVCANLLRYGAQAQSFKGSENAPADAAMTAEQKAYVTDLNTVSVNSVAKALGDVENGIAWAGKALVLDSKVAVKAIFNLKDYAGNKEDLNLRVAYINAEGEEITLVIDTMEVYSGEYYAFVVDALLATEMRSELAMALYESDVQVSETQIYSVESYCVGKTGALADLGKALLAYSDAAKAFFAK